MKSCDHDTSHMTHLIYFKYFIINVSICIFQLLLCCSLFVSMSEERRMNSNGNENETQVGSTTTCGSEIKDPRWKYAWLPNEPDLNTIICIFCDKVTKGGIYRHKQHLVGGHRNAKKYMKCFNHVRQETKDYLNRKKNQKEQLKMRNEDLDEDFEDIDEEVESRRVAYTISRRGSNRGRGSGKRSREKGLMDHFFHP